MGLGCRAATLRSVAGLRDLSLDLPPPRAPRLRLEGGLRGDHALRQRTGPAGQRGRGRSRNGVVQDADLAFLLAACEYGHLPTK